MLSSPRLFHTTNTSRFGGKLLFLMKMGPSTSDSSTAVCKPAYGGNVYLYYSLDGGGAWETLFILETFSYRMEDFTQVRHRWVTSRYAGSPCGQLLPHVTP